MHLVIKFALISVAQGLTETLICRPEAHQKSKNVSTFLLDAQ